MRAIPNILSISRLIATVIVFIFVLINRPWAYLVALIVFFLASVTDYLDGYLARRLKAVSSLGVFLDLTADKVFVTVILTALVQIGLVPAWVVAIIITREFLVSGLRSIASARGCVIPAGIWGKQKTFITLIAVGGLLLAKGLGAPDLAFIPLTSQMLSTSHMLLVIADWLIMLATVWTMLSGIEYLISTRWLLQEEKKGKIV